MFSLEVFDKRAQRRRVGALLGTASAAGAAEGRGACAHVSCYFGS